MSASNVSTTLTFTLDKKAKSSGGDKYICSTQAEFNVYVPQSISRNGEKEPAPVLQIVITPQS